MTVEEIEKQLRASKEQESITLTSEEWRAILGELAILNLYRIVYKDYDEQMLIRFMEHEMLEGKKNDK